MPEEVHMRRAFAALCAAGLLLTVLAPGAAAGGPPAKVTITSTMVNIPDQGNVGTFDVVGTAPICSHGDVYDINYVFGALLPGKLRQILVTKAFVCPGEEDGFLLKMQVHEDLTGAGSETFTWVIFKGFGAFEKLRGQGSGSTVSSDWATGPWINTYEGFVVD
jgi:hypothetical protein